MFSDLVKARWLKEMSQTPNMRFFARQCFTNEDLDSGPGKPAENHLLRIRGKEGAGRFEEHRFLIRINLVDFKGLQINQ